MAGCAGRLKAAELIEFLGQHAAAAPAAPGKGAPAGGGGGGDEAGDEARDGDGEAAGEDSEKAVPQASAGTGRGGMARRRAASKQTRPGRAAGEEVSGGVAGSPRALGQPPLQYQETVSGSRFCASMSHTSVGVSSASLAARTAYQSYTLIA